MTTNDLLEALARLRVETGSLACFGCGYEHNCSVRGCQILREAATQLEHFTAENRARRSLQIYYEERRKRQREEARQMLDICPVSLAEANAFVAEHHRHHKPVVGHKFSIGCTDGEKIVGVAIVGRPVARYLDDGWTLEVNRCCTDGTRNACSILYAAAWRAARAMGYHKLITYILDTEPGTSLKAAGWKCVGQAGGLRWTGKRRPEVDLCPAQMKIRFEREEGEKA